MNPKIWIGLIAGLGCGLILQAAKPKYPVADIPEELLKDAKSVVREREETFELNADRRATQKVRMVLTILNEDAIENADILIPYDKFTRVSDIEGTLYDKEGNKIRTVKPAEIIDFSDAKGYSLYEDNRKLYVDAACRTIPFTIEYSYTIHHKGLLYYPIWIPHESFEVAVEKSSFSVIVPKDWDELRYVEQNLNADFSKELDGSNYVYRWMATKLTPLKPEPLSPPIETYAPILFIAPSDFEIDGYEGNAENWENLGLWSYSLIENRDNLPEETVAQVQKLIESCKTDKQKIQVLYKYLQENTRYVNVTEGIGGWQPIDAETIDRLKYGDCKALTNYMKALLKAAGIESIYTRVLAGDDAGPLRTDFPSNQFNHVFLCIPQQNDTIWLECTNQLNPAGFLGEFTDDRDVLLVTENGGRIVRTPEYKAEDNLQIQKAIVKLNASGNGEVHLENTFRGIMHDNMMSMVLGDNTDREKRIYQRLDIPNFRLDHFEHKRITDDIPILEEKLDLHVDNYTTIMGDRMLLMLNLTNRWPPLPYDRDRRRSDIQIRREFLEIDSITYVLPEGYRVEDIPENKTFDSKYATYHYSITSTDSTLSYVRYFKFNKGIYDKSEYPDFYAYMEEISMMDELKAVLLKEEQ